MTVEQRARFKLEAGSRRALWGVNLAHLLECLVYFLLAYSLSFYLSDDMGFHKDSVQTIVSSISVISLVAMALLGGVSDVIGLRLALIVALLFSAIGRTILALAPSVGVSSQGATIGLLSPSGIMVLGGILLTIVGHGVWQPAVYSAAHRLSKPTSRVLAFAALYALMNVGTGVGFVAIPWRSVIGQPVFSGVAAGLTGLAAVVLVVIYRRNTQTLESRAAKSTDDESVSMGREKGRLHNWSKIFTPQFVVLLLVAIPVQTMLSHTWTTVPLYLSRAIEPGLLPHPFVVLEWNPWMVAFCAPVVALITWRLKSYNMIVLGSLLIALSTGLLVWGRSQNLFLGFFFFLTLGESIMMPRLYQYVAQIAPRGRTGLYLGISVASQSSVFLLTRYFADPLREAYCSEGGELNTELMWLIFGAIALTTGVALLVMKGWMKRGERRCDET